MRTPPSANRNTQLLHDDRDVLVYVFQRGAADGLNAVVPYSDSDYTVHRPTIAVQAPGGSPASNTAIDLDGTFGLHPALAALKPIYDAGDLALVHACGIPHGSRSHFAAQGLVERGVAASSGPSTGWLGRHLAAATPLSDSAFRTVAISGNVPVSLYGVEDPLAIAELASFTFDQGIIDLGYVDLLQQLFASGAAFAHTANAALAALDELHAANLPAISQATYPTEGALVNKLKQAALLIKSELPVEVVCLDSDGWDHHDNLPNFIQGSLSELGSALAAFYADLGDAMQRVTVVVHSEFGRRVAENASLGTDHGTAGVVYLMGGGVNGGQVISDWPGLATENLEMGEDLAITTDLRSLFSELLLKRLGGANLASLFPGFSGSSDINAFLPFS